MVQRRLSAQTLTRLLNKSLRCAVAGVEVKLSVFTASNFQF